MQNKFENLFFLMKIMLFNENKKSSKTLCYQGVLELFPISCVFKKRLLIPAAGVEPARPRGHWILSPARLPIPPRRQNKKTMEGGNRI